MYLHYKLSRCALALRALRAEPRASAQREWLVSSGHLFHMPGNWTDRNVYAFLGPGYLFGYLVKKMLTMRDYVKEMIKALAERDRQGSSLSPKGQMAGRSAGLGLNGRALVVVLDFVAQNVFTSRLGVIILRNSGRRIFKRPTRRVNRHMLRYLEGDRLQPFDI